MSNKHPKQKIYRPDLINSWELLTRTVDEIQFITKGGAHMKYEKKKGGKKGGQRGGSPSQGGTFWN